VSAKIASMEQTITRRMLGGHAVAQCLRNEGVRHAFSVPGESYIALLDGLRDVPDIRLITNRHEGSACLMAEAYGKTTRQPGVCIVTRGPGATNASIGVHLAKYDSTPLILLVGQVARAQRGREAGQELDYTHFFGSMAKWVVEINDPKEIPRIMARAFHVARTGRPGPVVVSLPRDMLEEEADITTVDPYPRVRPTADPHLIKQMVDCISQARKPVVVAGSGTQYADARSQLVSFAEKFELPVLSAFKRQDVFPNSHVHYVGNLGSRNNHARRIVRDDADLLVIVGCRFNQQVSGNYTLPPAGLMTIQIDSDPENIGQNFRPELAIVSDPKSALKAALNYAPSGTSEGRAAWIAEYHRCKPSTRPLPYVRLREFPWSESWPISNGRFRRMRSIPGMQGALAGGCSATSNSITQTPTSFQPWGVWARECREPWLPNWLIRNEPWLPT
jgi:acetolactate synthase-1/2/3 large subunit